MNLVQLINRNIFSTKFNIAISLIERIFHLAITLICVKLMANSLSIADNGKYAYANSLFIMLSSLSFWAGGELIMPRLSQYKYLRSSIMTHGIYLRLAYTIFAFLASCFFSYFFIQDSNIAIALLILMGGLFFSEIPNIFACYFMVLNQYVFISIARIAGFFMRLLFTYLIAKNNLSFENYSYAYLAEFITTGVLLIIIYYKSKHNLHITKFNYSILMKLLKPGLIIGIGVSLGFVFSRVDRYIIADRLTFDELGLYSVAIQLKEAFITVSQAIMIVLINKFIFAYKKPKNIAKIIYLIVSISIIAIISSIFLSKWVIINLIDPKYADSAQILIYVIGTTPLVLINYLYYNLLLKYKLYFSIITIWILGIIIMIISTKLMLASYAVYACIYASAISYAVMNLAYIYIYARIR